MHENNVKTILKTIFIIILITLCVGCKEKNNDIEQKEIRYDVNSNNYEEIETDKYYEGKETEFIQGDILEIKKQSDILEIVVLRHGEKELEMQVNKHAYIGNYTKSPKKEINYLSKGMKADINYLDNNGVLEIVTINVVQ